VQGIETVGKKEMGELNRDSSIRGRAKDRRCRASKDQLSMYSTERGFNG